MPLLNKGKAKAEAPAEETVEGVTREEFDALQAQVTELKESFDALVAELNAAGEEETPAEETPAEEAGEETPTEKAGEETPAEDSGEVTIPTVAEIKKADVAQLKKWRAELFDEADAKRPLEEIRKELMEVAKSSEAGEAEALAEETTEEAGEEAGEETPAEEPEEKPAKGKKGTNGNVFGLIQDAKTKLVSGVKMKPVLQCTTDLDKVVRLANTYACFFDEKACKCKTGDKKEIAECWKEFLNDADTKKLIAKEKGAKAPAPAPAKKPLLKKKK